MLNIITKLMSENDCYKAERTITPRGITIHSTAEPGRRAYGTSCGTRAQASRAGARSACMHLRTTK